MIEADQYHNYLQVGACDESLDGNGPNDPIGILSDLLIMVSLWKPKLVSTCWGLKLLSIVSSSSGDSPVDILWVSDEEGIRSVVPTSTGRNSPSSKVPFSPHVSFLLGSF